MTLITAWCCILLQMQSLVLCSWCCTENLDNKCQAGQGHFIPLGNGRLSNHWPVCPVTPCRWHLSTSQHSIIPAFVRCSHCVACSSPQLLKFKCHIFPEFWIRRMKLSPPFGTYWTPLSRSRWMNKRPAPGQNVGHSQGTWPLLVYSL